MLSCLACCLKPAIKEEITEEESRTVSRLLNEDQEECGQSSTRVCTRVSLHCYKQRVEKLRELMRKCSPYTRGIDESDILEPAIQLLNILCEHECQVMETSMTTGVSKTVKDYDRIDHWIEVGIEGNWGSCLKNGVIGGIDGTVYGGKVTLTFGASLANVAQTSENLCIHVVQVPLKAYMLRNYNLHIPQPIIDEINEYLYFDKTLPRSKSLAGIWYPDCNKYNFCQSYLNEPDGSIKVEIPVSRETSKKFIHDRYYENIINTFNTEIETFLSKNTLYQIGRIIITPLLCILKTRCFFITFHILYCFFFFFSFHTGT